MPRFSVAMVADDFLPAVTGVGVHVQKVSAELAARGHRVVVITSRRGANRAYATDVSRVAFQAMWPDDRSIVDANGVVWRVTEEQLVPPDPSTPPLPRVPAQRAFWFGWRAQYPDTILFK